MVDSVGMVALASGEALAAGAAVSVFCSQAARSAAPARMQMYFFIVRKTPSNEFRSKNAIRLCYLQRRLVIQSMCLGHCATRQLAISCINAANQGGLFFARFVQSEIRQ